MYDWKAAAANNEENHAMKTIQIYDKPMCCSTGICGPQVDPVLPRFASDLDWLKAQGHRVERYNLAQQPQAFVQNADVRNLLSEQGVDVLPVILLDGQIVSRQGYPSREKFAMWAGIPIAQAGLSILEQPADASCCDTGCC
jgi:arsenite methyltransferase